MINVHPLQGFVFVAYNCIFNADKENRKACIQKVMIMFNDFKDSHFRLQALIPEMEKAFLIIKTTYENNGKILACGNGGSCADADHIVGELMKGFLSLRPLSDSHKQRLSRYGGKEIAEKLQSPLRAINLASLPSLSSAFANDVDAELVYAQMALGLADAGDVFIGISTSGNANNVHAAAIVAKAAGAKLIALTGADGGKMRESGLYDVLIKVPETMTYKIQEAHIVIYHALCIAIEEAFFGRV